MEVFITKYILLLRLRLSMLDDWLTPFYICMELLNCTFFLFGCLENQYYIYGRKLINSAFNFRFSTKALRR